MIDKKSLYSKSVFKKILSTNSIQFNQLNQYEA